MFNSIGKFFFIFVCTTPSWLFLKVASARDNLLSSVKLIWFYFRLKIFDIFFSVVATASIFHSISSFIPTTIHWINCFDWTRPDTCDRFRRQTKKQSSKNKLSCFEIWEISICSLSCDALSGIFPFVFLLIVYRVQLCEERRRFFFVNA